MFAVSHLLGFGVGSGAQFSYAYVSNYSDATNTSSYSFAGCSLGTADSTRKVVVVIKGGDAGLGFTVSSVTVAGVAASLVVGDTSGNSENRVEIWSAAVPSGTTGTIAVTWSGTKSQCGIGVYAIYGASASAYATGTSSSGTTTTHTSSIDIPAEGCVIAVGGCASATATWTNADENFDIVVESPQNMSAASKLYASAQVALTITMTTSSSASAGLCCASWGA